MCGRYVSPDEAAIERAWHIGRHSNTPFVRRFNVAPTAVVPVLGFDRESGALELTAARWGLVPHWWKDARPPNASFNARVEDAAVKPMWRDALRRSRCLVPAVGWYEWQDSSAAASVSAHTRRAKQPYFIVRRDRRLLCFAGVLSRWVDPDTGEAVRSCAILTSAAKGTLAAIHERMPVVAPDALHAGWLDPQATGVAKMTALLAAGMVEGLECYRVSARVNDARADGPELIEPAAANGH